MNSKILKAIIYSLASAAIVSGIITLETCWEYWRIQMSFTTSASIVVLAAVILFCCGLVMLTVMYLFTNSRRTKHNQQQ